MNLLNKDMFSIESDRGQDMSLRSFMVVNVILFIRKQVLSGGKVTALQ